MKRLHIMYALSFFIGSLTLVVMHTQPFNPFKADSWSDAGKSIKNTAESTGSTLNKNVVQPIQKNVVDPTIEGTQKYLINPVVGTTTGSIQAIEGMVGLAYKLQNLIGAIQGTVSTVQQQKQALANVQKGEDIVDPFFAMTTSLISIPLKFQSVLEQLAKSIYGFETIVKPYNAGKSREIKAVADDIADLRASIQKLATNLALLNEKLHVHTKTIAINMDQAATEIRRIGK